MDDAKKLLASGAYVGAADGGIDSAALTLGAGTDVDSGVGVEDRNNGLGIAIGKAPDGAKPPGGLVEPPGGYGGEGNTMTEGGVNWSAGGGTGETEEMGTMGRNDAFETFKTSEGAAMNSRLLGAKRQLKAQKGRRAELARNVNDAKRRIDNCKTRLEAKKKEREAAADFKSTEEAEIIDEEEYAFIQESKSSKAAYKVGMHACHPTPCPCRCPCLLARGVMLSWHPGCTRRPRDSCCASPHLQPQPQPTTSTLGAH